MSTFLLAASLFLLFNLGAGLIRVYRGPQPADRMLSLLLFGSTTVAAVLLLAYAADHRALVVVALVFVLLAAIGSIAFIHLPRRGQDDR